MPNSPACRPLLTQVKRDLQPRRRCPKLPDISNPVTDKASDAVGLHGAVADVSRAAVGAAGGIDQANATVARVARVAGGDQLLISSMTAATLRAVGHTQMGWAAEPVAKIGGGVLRFLGKGAIALGIASAAYDTSNAIREKDADKKDTAWGTAALSVGGTILGTAGVMVGLGPLGVGLLGASAAIGVFQLADTYFFKGRGTRWLGDHVIRPVRSLFGK